MSRFLVSDDVSIIITDSDLFTSVPEKNLYHQGSSVHGLQSRPPSPKRAERKVRRRPFREAGSGQNNGTR